MPVLIAILVALAVSGGVSFAAQSSLPGNFLYPIKTGVNERVKEAFAFSDEAKAQVDADLAERRLEEGEEVAAGAELRPDIREDLAMRFKAFADRVDARTLTLADTDVNAAADIASNFEIALEAHARVLADLESQSESTEQAQLKALKETAEAEGKDAKDLKATVEAKIASEEAPDVQAAAEGRLGSAQNKIAEVRKFIASQRAKLSAGAIADAEAQLTVADQTVVDGQAKLAAKDYAGAFILFSSAHQMAEQAQIIAAAGMRLDTEVDIDGQKAAEDVRDEADLDVQEQEGTETGDEAEQEGDTVDVNADTSTSTDDNSIEGGADVNVHVQP